MLDLHRGNPSKLIGTYVASPLTWGAHVRQSSPLQSMADVDGATFGVSRMGSGSHLMACVDAHARGRGPPTLEVVGSLDGATWCKYSEDRWNDELERWMWVERRRCWDGRKWTTRSDVAAGRRHEEEDGSRVHG